MKIKYLAIALLSTTLISSPLFAKDKVKPSKIAKKIDAASPTNASLQASVDKIEIIKKKAESQLHEESTKESVNPMYESKSVTGLSSETEVVESQAKSAYLKIGDIQGESQRTAAPANHNTTRSNKTQAVVGNSDDSDNDDDAGATDYNSSRSNKADTISAGGSDDDSDDSVDDITKATDYNSSRSNKSYGANLDGLGDAEDNDGDENDIGATDYNSSRSNKADTISVSGGDDDSDDSDVDITKATDYNSSRSNKSLSAVSLDDGDSTNNDEADACDNLKKNETCVDGHVTVLK